MRYWVAADVYFQWLGCHTRSTMGRLVLCITSRNLLLESFCINLSATDTLKSVWTSASSMSSTQSADRSSSTVSKLMLKRRRLRRQLESMCIWSGSPFNLVGLARFPLQIISQKPSLRFHMKQPFRKRTSSVYILYIYCQSNVRWLNPWSIELPSFTCQIVFFAMNRNWTGGIWTLVGYDLQYGGEATVAGCQTISGWINFYGVVIIVHIFTLSLLYCYLVTWLDVLSNTGRLVWQPD